MKEHDVIKGVGPRHGTWGRGFTLIELLVVIAIIAILAAILVPAVQNALQTAVRTKVMAGLKGFGVAVHQYTYDHDGVLPGPTNGGQGARYSRTRTKSLVYHLWNYLDGDEPGRADSYIDVLVDGHREAAGYPTLYLRNGSVRIGDDPNYDVFGYPKSTARFLEPSPIEIIPAPAMTWMMHDTDKAAQPGHPGWWDSLPETAFHGKNVVLFFDTHCESFEKPKDDLY
mgnify:FL=1